jgi:hypothetical protein
MLRVLRIAAAGVLMAASCAVAQTTAPSAPDATTTAAATTELQARERIDKQGYTAVTGLKQDAQGLWHGSATKDGKTVDIMLDMDGKVVEKR